MVRNKHAAYRKKELRADRMFDIVNNIFLLFCFLVVSYPLIYIVSSSLSNAHDVMAHKVWLFPVNFDLTAYKAVFTNKQIGIGYFNSVFYVAFGTITSVILTMLLAYPLSRKEFYGRKTVTKLIMFTMLFTGGTIPLYLVVRNLGIYDSRWAMLLPNAVTVWNVVIARTFLQENITDELYDAAQIDGCSDIRFLFQMVFPLSKAIIAVLALFYAVSQWNKYFDALIYLQSQKLYPLQIVLRNILIINKNTPSMMTDVAAAARAQGLSETIRYALIVIASAPLLIIYPFVQKFFVKGVMIGSVKG
ncbi:carbohydrate ABC transporter permease [Parasphaerochaeta coccoides]|uniref:Carbohydrate ABC transporter membrane protein 2, CUT1 family n=1 Tax=Parasphaerochaeta coccoides (strain ATCC BAA-1237 / DSM 17374 / SPN1) TaxID=760011 RepID=F4GHQ4_PARC1|nr:carbohydrate ABC transporter permease [Parasphaerochaeta coccoides]AEC01592.1 carbohydrate ABC transporter membrane protein 2, CUT1 family [Parasphaerochaeta coccoides DSM 17374]